MKGEGSPGGKHDASEQPKAAYLSQYDGRKEQPKAATGLVLVDAAAADNDETMREGHTTNRPE